MGIEKYTEQMDREGVSGRHTSGSARFDKEVMSENKEPDPRDFIGETRYGEVVTEESIKEDMKKVIEIEQKPGFNKEQGYNAVAAEYEILHGINRSNWLGEAFEAEKTHTYDDYVNGTDALFTVRDPENYPVAHLGIDVTVLSNDTEENSDRLTAKYEREYYKVLKKGMLTSLKYHHCSDSFPVLILNLNSQAVEELRDVMAGDKTDEELLSITAWG